MDLPLMRRALYQLSYDGEGQTAGRTAAKPRSEYTRRPLPLREDVRLKSYPNLRGFVG